MPNPPVDSPKKFRMLVLCDSLAAREGHALTGFARVIKNIFSRFPPSVEIDFWSIGFDGHGYREITAAHPNWRLLPTGHAQWNSVAGLSAFLEQLAFGAYTHVFILMDADAISSHQFPRELKRVCAAKKIQSLLYYPVDAPLQSPFEIIDAVTTAVTFTEYGRQETLKAMSRSLFKVEVIPHGIDSHFTPITREEREKARSIDFQVADGPPGKDGKQKFRSFLKPGDFLILNVNKNEWRKDPLRSLEILKALRDEGVPAKMVLRMDPLSGMGGVNLEKAGEQLGLTLDVEWAHIPAVNEAHMRSLYGASDLVLSTSLGEGWGFSMTEALACGTPVAVPAHTSLWEIGIRVIENRQSTSDPKPVLFLYPEDGHVMGYDMRLRQRIDLELATTELTTAFTVDGNAGFTVPSRIVLPTAVLDWLSWDRIAKEFLKLMEIPVPILPGTTCPADPQKPQPKCRVELIVSVQTKGRVMKVQITTAQKVNIQAAFQDAGGVSQPLPPGQIPVWASSDLNIATVSPSADGLNCDVISVGPGLATISVTAEGDPSPGVDTIKGSQDITVVADEDTQVVLTTGAPIAK